MNLQLGMMQGRKSRSSSWLGRVRDQPLSHLHLKPNWEPSAASHFPFPQFTSLHISPVGHTNKRVSTRTCSQNFCRNRQNNLKNTNHIPKFGEKLGAKLAWAETARRTRSNTTYFEEEAISFCVCVWERDREVKWIWWCCGNRSKCVNYTCIYSFSKFTKSETGTTLK